jgi:hypothetical protein
MATTALVRTASIALLGMIIAFPAEARTLRPNPGPPQPGPSVPPSRPIAGMSAGAFPQSIQTIQAPVSDPAPVFTPAALTTTDP